MSCPPEETGLEARLLGLSWDWVENMAAMCPPSGWQKGLGPDWSPHLLNKPASLLGSTPSHPTPLHLAHDK